MTIEKPLTSDHDECKPMTSDAVVELMAEALWSSRADGVGPEWWDLSADMKSRGRMHIRAIVSALSDTGLAVLPMEAMTAEMARAFFAVKCTSDPDEMVFVPGTGNGDLAQWERWKDLAHYLDLDKRYAAAVAAFHPSQLETKDDQDI